MKLPFDFGIRFVLRLVAPGSLMAGISLPAVREFANLAYPGLPDIALLATSGLVFGFALLLLDMPIYMLLEGRRFWPTPLRRWGIKQQNKRLDRLKAKSKKASGAEQIELDIQAAQYPIERSTGAPHATHPTRLGNLLASFETYPTRKYGLDGVFYWPRLWVTIDKDLREELDSAQAVADGAIYCTFVLILAVPICFAYALLLPTTVDWHWPAAALACALGAWIMYQLVLPRYAQYGELFAATFDQHRDKLKEPTFLEELDMHMTQSSILRAEREKNRAAWRFLRWHAYRRPNSKASVEVQDW